VPAVRALIPSAIVKIYPEQPGAAVRQLVVDLAVVVWVYVWVRLAMALYDTIEKLAVPGQKLAGAGDRMADQFRDAGGKIRRVPIAGEDLAAPFNRAGDAARDAADAGRQAQEVVHDVAWALSIGLLVLPLGLVLLVWLPRRVSWMQRAGAASRLRAAPAGQDLLALRALVSQPLPKLTALDPDIAAAWRRGDPAAVERLAGLELRGLGLR
jgi:hypothetical protein